MSERASVQASNDNLEQRLHRRRRVLKSAQLYPILDETELVVSSFSRDGLSGQCALPLSMHQRVHVSFDDLDYIGAEVRWVKAGQCGLILDRSAPVPASATVNSGPDTIGQAGADCPASDLTIRLMTSAPVVTGTIKNVSVQGMRVEFPGLEEGTPLFVKTRDRDARRGRVEWSKAA